MRKIYSIFIFLIKQLFRYFWIILCGKNSCIICGNPCGIFHICENCDKEYFGLERILKYPRCKTCGKELLVTGEKCSECREEIIVPHADFIFSLFSYRLWNKELMFLWKTEEIRSISYFFARKLNDVLIHFNHKIIVPVPPRPGKILEKGWDQIDELCNFLEFFYGYKILKLLERKTKNQQKKLDRENRINTIGKGYTCISMDKISKELKRYKIDLPKEVCLLDDVCTTGATIESCCALLKNIGIKNINVITLFKVD